MTKAAEACNNIAQDTAQREVVLWHLTKIDCLPPFQDRRPLLARFDTYSVYAGAIGAVLIKDIHLICLSTFSPY